MWNPKVDDFPLNLLKIGYFIYDFVYAELKTRRDVR